MPSGWHNPCPAHVIDWMQTVEIVTGLFQKFHTPGVVVARIVVVLGTVLVVGVVVIIVVDAFVKGMVV